MVVFVDMLCCAANTAPGQKWNDGTAHQVWKNTEVPRFSPANIQSCGFNSLPKLPSSWNLRDGADNFRVATAALAELELYLPMIRF